MYLTIDSANRMPFSISSTNFVTNTDRLNDQLMFMKFRITQVNIPGTFYNINQYNKYLSMTYTDILDPLNPVDYDVVIQVPDGNYDVETLRATLEDLIRDNTNMGAFTVTLNPITYKYRFHTNDTSFVFQFDGGGDAPNNILDIIGFDDADTIVSSDLTAQYMVDFTGFSKFYIRINASGKNVFSDKINNWSDVVAIVPVSTVPYQNIDREFIRPMVINCSGFTQMNVRLTDRNNRDIDLNDHDWSFIMEILD